MTQETLIEKYILGTLNSEEKELVKQLIATDSNFKKELEHQSSLKEVIAVEEDEKFKAQLKDFEPNQTVTFKRPMFKWLVAASVLILVVAGTLLYFQESSADPLFAQHFEPYANVIQPVGRSSTDNDIKAKAFLAYENEAYKQAETYFTSLLNTTSDSYVLFYLANTKLALDKANEAIPLLNSYMSVGDNLSSQAQWYLALAHIQADQKAQARQVLEKIVAFEGYRAEDALILLEKLK
jgi:hypothetical protein